ncbi:Bug family tripartite tricarboxylate transporter substrate binding protein [Hydrogenophaga sp. UC242_50]|jgi:tripartite-type tricarboxylate transporter receptor subunit TctC|uniref:Bug family tripartite tricarboxylate transporter substrate binding protein n=1 Tax=unclassified Hydrogenophaga TaxID=2610897 RepID=UPI0036D431BF
MNMRHRPSNSLPPTGPGRRSVLVTLAAGLAAVAGLPAHAQADWPTRPVKLISPYGAGGASDLSARVLGEYLAKVLGQQIVVENKAGAGTRVATEFVARAPADGYTVLYVAAPYATAEALYGHGLSYQREQLRPLAMAMHAPLFLIVNAQTPIKSVRDLVEFSKTRPGGINIGSPGAGSQPHLAAELLLREAGMEGINVHMRGDAPAYSELLGGRVDATLTAISSALPHIEAGKLRVIGVASEARSALYPSAPTIREQGFPSVVASGWYGFMVPAATPREVVTRLQSAVLRALDDAAIKQKLLDIGLEASGAPGPEFARFIDDQTRKWTDVIRKAHIKVE